MNDLFYRKVSHKVWIVSIFVLISIVFYSCNGETEETIIPKKPDDKVADKNYIVLLDLSDRLLSSNQVERDIQLITKVFDGFYDHVRYKKFFIKSNDKFKIVFAKQSGIPYSKSEEENKLYLDMSIYNIADKKNSINSFKENLKHSLESFYSKAKFSKNETDYKGADIWNYFKDEIDNDLKEGYENVLILLTDGYMDFENPTIHRVSNRYSNFQSFFSQLRNPNWEKLFNEKDYGLVKLQKNYAGLNLKIAILEVQPKDGFPYEFDLIKKTWNKWLNEMSIKTEQQRILQKISIEEINSQLSEFLEVQIKSSNHSTKQSISNTANNDEQQNSNWIIPKNLPSLYTGTINIKNVKHKIILDIKKATQIDKEIIKIEFVFKIDMTTKFDNQTGFINQRTNTFTYSAVNEADKLKAFQALSNGKLRLNENGKIEFFNEKENWTLTQL